MIDVRKHSGRQIEYCVVSCRLCRLQRKYSIRINYRAIPLHVYETPTDGNTNTENIQRESPLWNSYRRYSQYGKAIDDVPCTEQLQRKSPVLSSCKGNSLCRTATNGVPYIEQLQMMSLIWNSYRGNPLYGTTTEEIACTEKLERESPNKNNLLSIVVSYPAVRLTFTGRINCH